MYFDSLHDLFYMNGHGAYVWSAYAIGFITVAILVIHPLLRHRRLRSSILQLHATSSQSITR
jgi:heme exporter protein D